MGPDAAQRLMAGLERVTRHTLTLPAEDELPALRLDVSVAPAARHPCSEPIVVYVLDPEPALFAAAGVSVHGGGGALTELALFACPECVDALCV